MLSGMPALEWLEIGDKPLLTTFKGTVRGHLSADTANTLRQATVGHVTGVCERTCNADAIGTISSIKSWSCNAMQQPQLIAKIAPNLDEYQNGLVF